jgi:hypothetical protein
MMGGVTILLLSKEVIKDLTNWFTHDIIHVEVMKLELRTGLRPASGCWDELIVQVDGATGCPRARSATLQPMKLNHSKMMDPAKMILFFPYRFVCIVQRSNSFHWGCRRGASTADHGLGH